MSSEESKWRKVLRTILKVIVVIIGFVGITITVYEGIRFQFYGASEDTSPEEGVRVSPLAEPVCTERAMVVITSFWSGKKDLDCDEGQSIGFEVIDDNRVLLKCSCPDDNPFEFPLDYHPAYGFLNR